MINKKMCDSGTMFLTDARIYSSHGYYQLRKE